MNKERLEHLRDIVRLPGAIKVDFNMGIWGVHTGRHLPEEDNYCGTAACAFGLATFDPEFQKQGLRAVWEVLNFGEGQKMTPKFGDKVGISAAAAFFEIPMSDAVYLFDPFTYGAPSRTITREMVIKRIEHLLREGTFL